MYNANNPNIDELPSKAQLLKSTIIAAVAAVVILVTVVLPAEYAIDPTGIGRLLGLTQMGEIRHHLDEEAKADEHSSNGVIGNSGFFASLSSVFIQSAYAAEPAVKEWQEQIEFVLAPSEGVEIKLRMNVGAQVEYLWVASGGRANYDLHGDGEGDAKGESTSYAKGRGKEGDEGLLIAAFDGVHGWFWRNRDKQDLTVTLYVRGDFTEVVRYKP